MSVTHATRAARAAHAAHAVEPRERILRAAAREIADRGFHGMSMRELARSAEMSLSNLYNYFPSKEEILFALQREAFEVLVASAEEALAGVGAATPSADARLYVFISHHVRYVAEHPEVMRVLVHEAASLPTPRRRAVRHLKERYFEIARSIVGDLVAGGCSRNPAPAEAEPCAPADAAELDRITYNLFGMLNWIYGWYEPRAHGGPHELARTIHRITMCGVVAHCPYRELQESLDQRLDSVAAPPLLGLGGKNP